MGGTSGGGASAGSIRAGRAHVELSAKDNLSSTLAGVQKKFLAVGRVVAGAGAVGIGAAGGLLGAALPTLDDLSRIDSTGKALGLTAEQASGLFGVLGRFSDLGENIEGITQFNQKVTDAFQGKGEEAAKLFEGLKVSAADLIALPLDEKFYRIHEAIRELPQDQQQFKLSMLGGTDSMKKWIPLLSMSTEELRRQAGSFRFSQEQLDAATAGSQAYKDALAELDRTWQQAAVSLAPVIKGLSEQVSGFFGGFREADTGWSVLMTRLELGWNLLWRNGRMVMAEFWDFLMDGWDSGVFVVRNLWLDLGEFLVNTIGDAMDKVVSTFGDGLKEVGRLLGAIPGLEHLDAAMGIAVGAGGPGRMLKGAFAADAKGQRERAQADLDGARAVRAVVMNAIRENDRVEIAALRAKLDANLAKVNDLQNKKIDNATNAPAVQVARVLDFAFGANGYLGQALGKGQGNPMVREQQRTNEILKDLYDAVTTDRRGLVFA